MDIKKLIEGIEQLLGYMFGGQTPPWLLPAIAWSIGLGLFLLGVTFILSQIKKLWTEFIQPGFYNPEERRRRFRRHMFADHIESEIRNMNSLESWNDNRFTELEAHVEAEGSQRLYGLFQLRILRASGIRLEKSLSNAIEKSSERLVLLEGDPGSGKSVALRHVTQLMAAKAHTSRNLKTRIPIYVNLKYLRRAGGENVDRNLIEKFIFKMLNRVNDRDVDEYLHDEFNRGLEEGTWFFLFDSFDEIPEILSSTGTDDLIRTYAEAIRDFLHGMNNCKGIVASREYKGPRFLGWPKFRILPLESSRRVNLVKRTNLPLNIQKKIIEGLAISIDDFRVMASNPMFLNLICDFMNKPIAPEFPRHIHIVFQEYVRKRLTRDEERVKGRFNKTPEVIQDAAEKLAYCMTADQGIGLSPTLEQLEISTGNMGINFGEDFSVLVEALAYLKLARMDTSFVDGSKTFTFAHRRFQEYFATAIVLRQPERVSNYDLLTNGRWRETAVVILQTQSGERVASLLNSAEEILYDLGGNIIEEFRILRSTITKKIDLPKYRFWSLAKRLFEPFSKSRLAIRIYIQIMINNQNISRGHKKLDTPVDWPQSLYHILSILQEGVSGSLGRFPAKLQLIIDDLIMSFSERGDILDEKMSLELAGITSEEYLIKLLEKGIARGSRITKQISFRQISKLPRIQRSIERFINSTLCEMAVSGRLFYERQEVYAQLSRLQGGLNYLRSAKFLAWAPAIDLVMLILGWLLLFLYYHQLLVLLLIFLIIIWFATWLSGSLSVSTVSRIYGIGFIIFLLFSNANVALSSWMLPRVEIRLENAYQTQSIPLWIFVALTGWGTILAFYFSSQRVPHHISWPFLGLIPVLLVGLILTATPFAVPFFEQFLNLVNAFGIYVVILVSLDWMYLFSRSLLIFQETHRKYKFEELFRSYFAQIQDTGSIWLLIELFLILIPLFIVRPVVFVAIEFIVIALMSGPEFYHFVRGVIIYLGWVRTTKPRGLLMFIQELELNKSRYIRKLMLKRTNDKQLIEIQTNDPDHLRSLISFVSARIIYKDDSQHKRIMEIDPLLGNVLRTDKWDIGQLDELIRMLDQFQASRISNS